MSDLSLDPAIRDWVVLPLFLIIMSAGLLRHQTSILLRNPKKIVLAETVAKSLLMRCGRLRQNHRSISPSAFTARKEYFASSKNKGLLRDKVAESDGKKAPSASPMGPGGPDMMGGMMGNMAFMVQNMVMMQGVGHFFSGFVLVKVPFPLTKGFKMMFQRGLNLNNLENSYVSSVSWYFLVMYGLRGFFRLVIGDPSDVQKDDIMLQASLGSNVMGGGGAFDANKMYKSEGDNLEILRYGGFTTADAELAILGDSYKKAKKSKGTGAKENAGDDIYQ